MAQSTRKQPCLDRFHGEYGAKAANWLAHAISTKELCGWDASETAQELQKALRGAALSWHQSWVQGRGTFDDAAWAAWQTAFQQRFGLSQVDILHQLANCRQLEGEPVMTYKDRLLSLCRQLAPAPGNAERVQYFLQGIRGDFRPWLCSLAFATLDAAAERAKDMELWSARDAGQMAMAATAVPHVTPTLVAPLFGSNPTASSPSTLFPPQPAEPTLEKGGTECDTDCL